MTKLLLRDVYPFGARLTGIADDGVTAADAACRCS